MTGVGRRPTARTTLRTTRGDRCARAGWSTPPGCAPTSSTACSATTASRSRPRRGELIVFDKLARPLVRHILLPVPTATRKGVLVAPDRLRQRHARADRRGPRRPAPTPASTADGLAPAASTGARILPALLDEEVTAIYAGLRAATEHADYQIDARRRRSATSASAASARPGSRVDGDRRARARRCSADGRARRSRRRAATLPRRRMPNLGEAFPRPYQRGRADRRRPRVRPHRLPLRARHPRARSATRSRARSRRRDLDGLRRRTRALMGRCQGFYCGARRRGPLRGSSRLAGRADERGARRRPGERSTSLVVGGGPGRAGRRGGARRGGRRRGRGRSSARPSPAASRATPTTSGYGLRDLHRRHDRPRATRGGSPSWRERRRRRAPHARRRSTGWAGDAASLDDARPGGVERSTARAVVLATGARERPRSARLVPGDRPAGVMHHRAAAAARPPAARPAGRQRAVVVGAEHVSFSAVLTLRDAGVRGRRRWSPSIRATRPTRRSGSRRRRAPGVPLLHPDARSPRSTAAAGVEAVELTDSTTGATRRIACDTVVFTGDWIPDHELAALRRPRPRRRHARPGGRRRACARPRRACSPPATSCTRSRPPTSPRSRARAAAAGVLEHLRPPGAPAARRRDRARRSPHRVGRAEPGRPRRPGPARRPFRALAAGLRHRTRRAQGPPGRPAAAP